MPYSTPIALIDLYIKKANMPVCPESMHRARWFYDTVLLDEVVTNKLYTKQVDSTLLLMSQFAYLGLGVVDWVKRKFTDLEALEPFLYTTINTIRDWINEEPVDVSWPVSALVHELTKYGYTYFDIIMASSPEHIIMVTLLENRTERFTDEH